MLGECPEDQSAFETGNHSYFAYIDIRDVDQLYKEYESKEVEIIAEPTNKPWGQREFGIRTIDSHRILFGESIEGKSNS